MIKEQYDISSLSEIHDMLTQSKKRLKDVLNMVDFSSLDLTNTNYTSVCGRANIESVLQSLPNEQQLQKMVNQATQPTKQATIASYNGDYRLVKEMQNNLVYGKPQAIDAYFILVKVKPIHLSSAEQFIKDNGELHSWNIHKEEEKPVKYEKNALHHQYRQSLKAKQAEKRHEIPKIHELSEFQLMVHVTLYDSHSKQKQNQFICYGRQHLTTLADSFYCLIEQLTEVKDRKIGSFIAIDSIFYNDTRERREDLSKNIIDRARQNGKSDIYTCYSMQKTRISDLRVEVGRPYVYRHQGGCDHMIVFNQVRLFDSSIDIIDARQYPLNVYEKRLKRRRCQACQTNFASLIVLDDRMKDGQTGYYCGQCHRDMNLDVNGHPKFPGLMVIKYFHD